MAQISALLGSSGPPLSQKRHDQKMNGRLEYRIASCHPQQGKWSVHGQEEEQGCWYERAPWEQLQEEAPCEQCLTG